MPPLPEHHYSVSQEMIYSDDACHSDATAKEPRLVLLLSGISEPSLSKSSPVPERESMTHQPLHVSPNSSKTEPTTKDSDVDPVVAHYRQRLKAIKDRRAQKLRKREQIQMETELVHKEVKEEPNQRTEREPSGPGLFDDTKRLPTSESLHETKLEIAIKADEGPAERHVATSSVTAGETTKSSSTGTSLSSSFHPKRLICSSGRHLRPRGSFEEATTIRKKTTEKVLRGQNGWGSPLDLVVRTRSRRKPSQGFSLLVNDDSSGFDAPEEPKKQEELLATYSAEFDWGDWVEFEHSRNCFHLPSEKTPETKPWYMAKPPAPTRVSKELSQTMEMIFFEESKVSVNLL